MYNEYFGLTDNPFSIAPDPRFLYMSEKHREALAHLLYGLEGGGGFVLLTGEVGTGKTTVCRCLLEQVPEGTEVALVLNPKLTATDLLATICDEFRITYPEGNSSAKVFIDRLNDFLLKTHSKGHNAVLIIDEAQNLGPEVLEQIRLLTNLETNRQKLLQIIMLGQPELRRMLDQPELRQLAQRITARYHLTPLSQAEISIYIHHRLTVAGSTRALFPTSTIKALYRLSGGIPRLINVLCDRSLLGAYARGHSQVTKKLVLQAAREVLGDTALTGGVRISSPLRWSALAAGLAACGILLFALKFQPPPGAAVSVAPPEETASEITEADPPAAVPVKQPLPVITDLTTVLAPEGFQRPLAFRDMFTLWGIEYDPALHGKECRYAKTYALRCLAGQASLRSLAHLNRPAVLTLYDDRNRPFYLTLVRLEDEWATILLGGQPQRVAAEAIESRWLGDYTLVWSPPPGYIRSLEPGDTGTTVNWLDSQLALLNNRPPAAAAPAVLNDTLLTEVKRFQLAQGLEPDGIAGPQTLIRLNTVSGAQAPTIYGDREER